MKIKEKKLQKYENKLKKNNNKNQITRIRKHDRKIYMQFLSKIIFVIEVIPSKPIALLEIFNILGVF